MQVGHQLSDAVLEEGGLALVSAADDDAVQWLEHLQVGEDALKVAAVLLSAGGVADAERVDNAQDVSAKLKEVPVEVDGRRGAHLAALIFIGICVNAVWLDGHRLACLRVRLGELKGDHLVQLLNRLERLIEGATTKVVGQRIQCRRLAGARLPKEKNVDFLWHAGASKKYAQLSLFSIPVLKFIQFLCFLFLM